MSRIRILVACGSGVATSTLASRSVAEVCETYHIDASIETCSMSGVKDAAESADVVLTTNRYDKPLSCPVMSVTSFITGLRVDATKQALGELLEKIVSEKQH
ncbi:MAG: PTS sugar transporter subunit IIB [Longicatena sp.]